MRTNHVLDDSIKNLRTRLREVFRRQPNVNDVRKWIDGYFSMHEEDRYILETTTKPIDEISASAYREIVWHGNCWDGQNPNLWRYVFPRLIDDWLTEKHNRLDMQLAVKWFTPDHRKNFKKEEQELIVKSFELAFAKSIEFDDPHDISGNLRVLLILGVSPKRIIAVIQSASTKGRYQLAEAIWDSGESITEIGNNAVLEDLPINQEDLDIVYAYLYSPEFSDTLK